MDPREESNDDSSSAEEEEEEVEIQPPPRRRRRVNRDDEVRRSPPPTPPAQRNADAAEPASPASSVLQKAQRILDDTHSASTAAVLADVAREINELADAIARDLKGVTEEPVEMFTLDDVARKLKARCDAAREEDPNFNPWDLLGDAALKFSRCVEVPSFLNGAIEMAKATQVDLPPDREPARRRVRKVRVPEGVVVAHTVEEVEVETTRESSLLALEAQVPVDGTGIPFFDLVMDKNYSKTVENLFDVSMLVQKRRVRMDIVDDLPHVFRTGSGMPLVEEEKETKEQPPRPPEAVSTTIIAFDYRYFVELLQAMEERDARRHEDELVGAGGDAGGGER